MSQKRMHEAIAVCVVVMTGMSIVARQVRADGTPLVKLDAPDAVAYGSRIVEIFRERHKNLQVLFEPDSERAYGMINVRLSEGIIVVPKQGLKDEPDAKKADVPLGDGLCYLVLAPRYRPIVDGKLLDMKKVRTLKFADGDGNEHVATCFVCTLKHIAGGDWQLWMYGAAKEPILKVPFKQTSNPPGPEIAVAIEDPKDDKATLVLTFFGSKSAAFTISHKHD